MQKTTQILFWIVILISLVAVRCDFGRNEHVEPGTMTSTGNGDENNDPGVEDTTYEWQTETIDGSGNITDHNAVAIDTVSNPDRDEAAVVYYTKIVSAHNDSWFKPGDPIRCTNGDFTNTQPSYGVLIDFNNDGVLNYAEISSACEFWPTWVGANGGVGAIPPLGIGDTDADNDGRRDFADRCPRDDQEQCGNTGLECQVSATSLYQLRYAVTQKDGTWKQSEILTAPSSPINPATQRWEHWLDSKQELGFVFYYDQPNARNIPIVTYLGGDHHFKPDLWPFNSHLMITAPNKTTGAWDHVTAVLCRGEGWYSKAKLNARGGLGVSFQDINEGSDQNNAQEDADIDFAYLAPQASGSLNTTTWTGWQWEAVEMLGDSGFNSTLVYDDHDYPVVLYMHRDTNQSFRNQLRFAVRDSGNTSTGYQGFPGVGSGTKCQQAYNAKRGREDQDTFKWSKVTIREFGKTANKDYALSSAIARRPNASSILWACVFDMENSNLLVGKFDMATIQPDPPSALDVAGIAAWEEKVKNAWSWRTLDRTGNVGRSCSIAVDADGNPGVVYLDRDRGKIKYAHLDNDGIWRRGSVTAETGDRNAATHPKLEYARYNKADKDNTVSKPIIIYTNLTAGTIHAARPK